MDSPFNRIFAASLTPLTESFEPNIPVLVDHSQWLLESGADGVALLGSTGEANSMTIEQRLEIIKNSTRKLPREKLMIGTGSCALKDTVNLTKESINAGVNSVLILPPFYYKPLSDESVIRYFSELISIVNDSNLRIFFYNFPKLTGYNFSIKILKEFKKQFGEIAAGIKDSSGEWENTSKIVKNVPKFLVFSGTESFLLSTLFLGGAGCISASANLTSKECQKVVLAWKKDQKEKAEQSQIKLSKLRKILETHPFVSGLKGLFANQPNSETWEQMLPPFKPLLSEQVQILENQIKEFGIDLGMLLRKN